MGLLRIFEIAAGAIIVILAVTQMVIPILRGTLLFPLFRKEHELESQLSRARQEELEVGLQHELKKRQQHIAKLKDDKNT
jgi:hypothetical protein